MGHSVSSPREREKREEIVEELTEGQRRKRKRNDSKETEIKKIPLYPYLLQGYQALPNCKPISIGHPGDVRYTTPSPYLTTPFNRLKNIAQNTRGTEIHIFLTLP